MSPQMVRSAGVDARLQSMASASPAPANRAPTASVRTFTGETTGGRPRSISVPDTIWAIFHLARTKFGIWWRCIVANIGARCGFRGRRVPRRPGVVAISSLPLRYTPAARQPLCQHRALHAHYRFDLQRDTPAGLTIRAHYRAQADTEEGG